MWGTVTAHVRLGSDLPKVHGQNISMQPSSRMHDECILLYQLSKKLNSFTLLITLFAEKKATAVLKNKTPRKCFISYHSTLTKVSLESAVNSTCMFWEAT